MAEQRPTLTASARAGVRNHGRGGRKPAARSNKRKEVRWSDQESKKASKKLLALVAAIRERKDGADRTEGWDFPLPLPARCIGFGKRKCQFFWHHHCHEKNLVSFYFASPIILCASNSVSRFQTPFVTAGIDRFSGQLWRWKQNENHRES